LMLDGYKMSEQELRQAEATKSLVAPAARFPQWHFLKIEPFLLNPTPEYLRQLNVAHQNLFKVYKLSRAVTIVTLFVLAALAGTLWHNFGEEFQSWLAKSVTIGYLLFMLAMTVLGIVTPFLSRTITALRWLRAPSDLLFRLVARAVIPALGSVFVVLHLMVFDRLFLRRGKVDNL
jgi:NTE family protein